MKKLIVMRLSLMFLVSIFGAANANENLLWTSKLNKNNSYKNYSFINESGGAITENITEIVGSRPGKDMLDSSLTVKSRSNGVVIVDSTLKSPDLQGNRISTHFSEKNYSIQKSNILESYTNGRSQKNTLVIMLGTDVKGEPIRNLTETATEVTTQLLDSSAPLVDLSSIIYLMAGINDSHIKIMQNKPVYFYLRGTIRKATIQVAGNDNISWFGNTQSARRFNLLRESENIGSLWVDPKSGDPLKIKVGMLDFSIKPN